MNKPLKYLVVTAASVIAVVVVVELVLRLALPVDEEIPTKLILNNRLPGFKEKVRYEVDTDLLRKLGWTEGEKPAGSLRVICLGGAGTVGVLQNAEDTWWGQMKKRLEEASPGRKVQIAALGVESRGIRFGAKWAQTYLPELKPDLVIAQYGVYDVLMHPQSYAFDESGLEQVKLKRERTGIRGALIRNLQIFRRISHSRQTARRNREQKKYGQTNFYASVLDVGRRQYQDLDLVFKIDREAGHDPVAEYLQSLRVIVGAAREAGAKVLLTGEPSLCGEFISAQSRSLLMMPVTVNDPANPLRKPEPGWVEKELYRYYANAQNYATDNRIPFVQLHAVVPQDPTHFFNEAVLTDAGAAVVAEKLLPEVQKLLAK